MYPKFKEINKVNKTLMIKETMSMDLLLLLVNMAQAVKVVLKYIKLIRRSGVCNKMWLNKIKMKIILQKVKLLEILG